MGMFNKDDTIRKKSHITLGGTITEWTDRSAQIKNKNPTSLRRHSVYCLVDEENKKLAIQHFFIGSSDMHEKCWIANFLFSSDIIFLRRRTSLTKQYSECRLKVYKSHNLEVGFLHTSHCTCLHGCVANLLWWDTGQALICHSDKQTPECLSVPWKYRISHES